ncbi:MAG: type II/IV secretion system protein [Sebaldella sp.]|nr:type II/IV secretion system protein [Sebaldella sp.]
MGDIFKIYNNKENIIEYVNKIIKSAVIKNVSDIHININDKEFNVKYRIDGVLKKVEEFSKESNKLELIARIKIMSNMNIAEKRLPQDGKISININGSDYDIRVSSIPTVNGESLVLRVLKNDEKHTGFEALGFNGHNLMKIKKLLAKKHGLILISGPTGSGKTTTLFSLISKLNDESKKIITIEDPVEKKISNITQIQVKEKIGLTFLEGLKYILRHDPDIIIIGEVRDKETAEMVVKTALTGHLVLATIHTNDTLSTIFRLIDMGIPKYLILNSVIGVISQRLIRKICTECMGESCLNCTDGYKSRMNINEILVFDEEISEIFRKTESIIKIKEKLKEKGFINLLDDAHEKERVGFTNKAEIYRVLGEY